MSLKLYQHYFFNTNINDVFENINNLRNGKLQIQSNLDQTDLQDNTKSIYTIFQINNVVVCENNQQDLTSEEIAQLSKQLNKEILSLDHYEGYFTEAKLYSGGNTILDVYGDDEYDENARFVTSDPRFIEMQTKFNQIMKDYADEKYDLETDDFMLDLEANGLDFRSGPDKIFEILGYKFIDLYDLDKAQEKIVAIAPLEE